MTCHNMEKIDKRAPVKPSIENRMTVKLGMILFVALAVLGMPAMAAVNWTNITTLIDGITGILPAISNLISAIIEPIIVLSVVGFLVGMLQGLLGGLEGAMHFGRR